MSTTLKPNSPRRLAQQALAPGRSAHDRQRDLVRASLLTPCRSQRVSAAR
jgi:hypothetical protein